MRATLFIERNLTARRAFAAMRDAHCASTRTCRTPLLELKQI
jgi:hypothetical protein